MAITFTDAEIETGLVRFAEHLAIPNSKRAVALAILRRALEMTDKDLESWLLGERKNAKGTKDRRVV